MPQPTDGGDFSDPSQEREDARLIGAAKHKQSAAEEKHSADLGKYAVGERKNLTCLFADVVGSTERVNHLDPEDAAQMLISVIRSMSRVTAEYGGTVINELGDGIMSVFGAPIAIEDHAAAACHAALAMQRLMSRQAEEALPSDEKPIAIRIGISTGETLVVREPVIDVFGITLHIASRLQAVAKPGEICIGEETYSVVQNVFGCTPLGPKSLKGVDKPVSVYRLDRALTLERPRFWNVEMPFVGRSKERAIIAEALVKLTAETIKEGTARHGAILGIWGEAGIGKSRLLEHMRSQAGDSVLWLQGFGVSFGQAISYLPFLQIIRRYIGARDTEDEATITNRLDATVRDMFGDEADDVLPYLATFLGLPVGSVLKERVMYLDGEQMGRQIRRSLLLLFERIATRRPTVLVFEDFYAADDSSKELVEHLLPLTESEPIIICFVGRGERDGVDGRLRQVAAEKHQSVYVDIHLAPLTYDETDDLLDRFLGVEARIAPVREKILANSEGNPLFIEEVLRALFEAKTIVRNDRDGKWHLNSDAYSIRIPDTIRDVIAARVDRLSQRVKDLLTIAAVIGRTFDHDVLWASTERSRESGSAIESIQEFEAAIAELLHREFIVERGSGSKRKYRFRHAMIEETIYGGMLKSRRRQLHQMVGEVLERLYAQPEEISGVLAYHFGRAENPKILTKALEHLFRAGEQADRLSANAEALHYYHKAVDVCEKSMGHTQQVLCHRKLGEAYYRRGEHDKAKKQFSEALICIGRGGDYKNLSTRRALVSEILVQCGHALWLSPDVKSTADDYTDHQIDIYRMWVWMVLFDDPARYLLYTLTALNEAERRAHSFGVGWSSCALAFGCNTVGFSSLATYYHRKAQRAAERCGSPLVKSMASLVQGWHLAYGGIWDEAIRHYSDAAQLALHIGDSRSWGSAAFGLSLLYCHQGRLNEAWNLTSNVLKTGEETGDQISIRYGALLKGMVLLRLGHLDRSESSLRSGMELSLDANDSLTCTHIAAELGACLIRQGRLSEADAELSKAERNVRDKKVRGHAVAFLRTARAELENARIETSGGQTAKEALKRARRACEGALAAGQIFSGAYVDALRLMGNYLCLTGNEPDARKHWSVALERAKALDSRYFTARLYLDIGRVTSNDVDTKRGAAMLAEMMFDTR